MKWYDYRQGQFRDLVLDDALQIGNLGEEIRYLHLETLCDLWCLSYQIGGGGGCGTSYIANSDSL
jgi:hypothetical protein